MDGHGAPANPVTEKAGTLVVALTLAATIALLNRTGRPAPSNSTQSQSTSPPTVDVILDSSPTVDDDVLPLSDDLPATIEFAEEVVGRAVTGAPIQCLSAGKGDYVVLMLASIHGNESAGTPLLQKLAEFVCENPDMLTNARLILIPTVNPDGVESGQRLNRRGVDLNRNFPAENRQNSTRYGLNALSEPEALAVFEVINRELPNHIVTLHEPLQCVDYDGPAAKLAGVMSEHCPLPVRKLGSRPGSLGAFAGDTLGIPIITLELPPNASQQSDDLLWRFYGEALVQAARFRHENADSQ